MKNKLSQLLKPGTAFILLLILWQTACSTDIWTPYILPSPVRVYTAFIEMLFSGELAEAAVVSLQRIFIGFSLSFVFSFAVALFGCLLPGLRPYYEGLLNFLRHVPPLALIPLLILWSGIGEPPKIIVIILATFGPLLLSINAGLWDCDSKLLEVGKVLGFTPFKSFLRIRLPYSLPGIFIGLRIGLGYALRAIIGAELIAAGSGIGYLILDSQLMSRTDKALVGILFIGLAGIFIDFFMELLQKKLLPYEEVK